MYVKFHQPIIDINMFRIIVFTYAEKSNQIKLK